MLKEAIEKIESMSKPFITKIEGHDYSILPDGTYIEILPELIFPSKTRLSSLDAVVEMVKIEAIHMTEAPVLISVPSATEVKVFSKTLSPDTGRGKRIEFYTAEAVDVPGWNDSVKLPFDQAAVALQTRFQESADREYCLRLLSNITTGAKVTYNDTGVATTVVTQKGVALQENQQIKPLVKLKPYRTFQEVDQPEGLFLIRIDERGITFVEADGGMWKLEARKIVAGYLEEALESEIEKGEVVVML